MKKALTPLTDALNLHAGDRIALTGGGGKTSLLYALARENPFGRGLYTTTTKMYDPAESPHPFHRLLIHHEGDPPPLPSQRNESCFISSGKYPEDNKKVLGLSNKLIERWKCMEQWPILVIEADGAAGKPIKAPRTGEPVIPGCVNKVLGCIGLDALGKPLSPQWVHRCDLFRERFCSPGQEYIEPEMIKNLIIHPGGLFQNTPADSEKWVILNKRDCLAAGYDPVTLLKDLRKELRGVHFLVLSLYHKQVVIYHEE